MRRSILLLPLLLSACTVDVGDGAYLGEVWADNWSSMYVGEELVMEDSVSITTERSCAGRPWSRRGRLRTGGA